MYEDLVKRLRNRANGSYEVKCEGCEFIEDFPPCVHCTIKAFNDAADALEDLQKLTDAQLDIIKQYQVYLTKQHWISVAERLPEESEGLNWHQDMMIRFTSVWCCDINTGRIAVRNRLQGKKTGNEYLDQYTQDTAWHWSAASWEPTHWLPIVPLPTPPKEET